MKMKLIIAILIYSVSFVKADIVIMKGRGDIVIMEPDMTVMLDMHVSQLFQNSYNYFYYDMTPTEENYWEMNKKNLFQIQDIEADIFASGGGADPGGDPTDPPKIVPLSDGLMLFFFFTILFFIGKYLKIKSLQKSYKE